MNRKITRPDASATSAPARHIRSSPARDADELVRESRNRRRYRPSTAQASAAVAGSIEVPLTTNRIGQEHREQAGNAEHDAAIEREGVDRILVGVRFPEIDLRQFGRRQFGDEGDDRAGVERDAEDVRLVARLPVERKAFARRDRDDALRPEIRPEELGIHQTEMRRDDHALELLVRNVGERKDRPVALMVLASWRAPRCGGRCRRRRPPSRPGRPRPGWHRSRSSRSGRAPCRRAKS